MSESECTEIIIIGANGRMGKTIAALAGQESNFKLAGAVDSAENLKFLADLACPAADDVEKILDDAPNAIIIDFTAPGATLKSCAAAARHGRSMVIGTTGFNGEQKKQLRAYAQKSPMLWSANMSVGINVIMRVLPMLADALGNSYDMEIAEIHHKRKKDAPSGTALMLGEILANARGQRLENVIKPGRNGITGERAASEIGIHALRGGDVAGVHECFFFGPGEYIEVSHHAESRENFARGALRAAVWLRGKTAGKLYSMQDVLFGE